MFCKLKKPYLKKEKVLSEKKQNVFIQTMSTHPPPPAMIKKECQKHTYRYVTLPAVTSADMVRLERRK